jgi:hypothetical protein
MAVQPRRRAWKRLSISVEIGPPSWDVVASMERAYDPEKRRAFAAAKPARGEAARRTAAALEAVDARERGLRASLASDLRDARSRL